MQLKNWLFTVFSLLSLNTLVFAKEINIYEQPKLDSKIVAKVDLAAGIIPIFAPKNSEWMKIADPKNGNVGWIQSSELKDAGAASYTFTQQVIDGKPETQQFIQYGAQPEKLNAEQEKIMKNMQEQQQLIQQSLQKAYLEMMNAMQRLYQYNSGLVTPTPMVTPMMKLTPPAQKNATPAHTDKQSPNGK
jgi:hypothetical protein